MKILSRAAIAILAVATAIASSAAPLTADEALRAIGQHPSKSRAARAITASRLTLAHTAYDATLQPVYYAFNSSDGGFVIAAADDLAVPMLAYADAGTFDLNAAPENMRVFLTTYTKELEALRSGRISLKATAVPQQYEPVAPLLGTIMWDQGAPFNDMCVEQTGIDNCATGCVATAFAQIMRYYRYPEAGSGSKTYTDQGKQRTADFNTTYDWDLMLPIYNNRATTAERAEVAKLMWHVGVASEMGYGESSGAYSSTATSGLIKYFGYDQGAYLEQRDYWEVGEWCQKLRDELAAGRPISYAGYNGSWEGHQFVIDGYDADGLFHLNWGWSGASNGYFAISLLSPGAIGIGGAYGGFNYGQEAVFGLQPDCGTETSHAGRLIADQISLQSSANTYDAGATVTFNLGRISNIGYGRFQGYVAIGLYVDGELVEVGTGSSVSLYPYGSSYSKPKFALPELDADCEVTFRPLQRYGAETTWQLMGTSMPYHTLTATYSGGIYTFGTDEVYDYEVTDATFDNVYTGCNATVRFNFVNKCGLEYKDRIQLRIYDAENSKQVAKFDDELIDAAAYTTLPVAITVPVSTAAGDYTLRILNDTGTTLATVPFTIAAAEPFELSIANIEMPEGTKFYDNHITAIFTVANAGGYFNDFMSPIITNSTGKVLDNPDMKYVEILGGSTTDVVVDIYTTLPPGNYQLRLAYIDGEYLTPIYGTGSSQKFTLAKGSGIDGVSTASQDTGLTLSGNTLEAGSPVRIYTATGALALHANAGRTDIGHLAPGVYIAVAGTDTLRFVKR